eukprot:scaffold66056_cov43-Phaeocystis_antarctica.AAC.1
MDASRLALLELGLASHHAAGPRLAPRRHTAANPNPNPSPNPDPSPNPLALALAPTPNQACCRSRRRWSRASSKTTCYGWSSPQRPSPQACYLVITPRHGDPRRRHQYGRSTPPRPSVT